VVEASFGYICRPFRLMYDLDIRKTVGPPVGTVYGYPVCDFWLCENCRHSCGLCWRARVSGWQIPDFRLWTGCFVALVSARHFPISVSPCPRPVRCVTETGRTMVFSWPSKAGLFDYAYDRDSAMFSRDDFAATICAFGYLIVAATFRHTTCGRRWSWQDHQRRFSRQRIGICMICRRCRNYAARVSAGRPARHLRWRSGTRAEETIRRNCPLCPDRYRNDGDRTAWLGMEDSNQQMSISKAGKGKVRVRRNVCS
jgi:Alpha/beta hydrolase of unknown function (DUF900)